MVPEPPASLAGAAALCRGLRRALAERGLAALTEVTLPDGRRADLCALDEQGEIWVIEIKSSLADFRSDSKWPDYRAWCDRLFFCVAPEFPLEVLPEDCGLFLADAFGAHLARPAPEHRLAPARRRALTLRLARLGALRLLRHEDPQALAAGG